MCVGCVGVASFPYPINSVVSHPTQTHLFLTAGSQLRLHDMRAWQSRSVQHDSPEETKHDDNQDEEDASQFMACLFCIIVMSYQTMPCHQARLSCRVIILCHCVMSSCMSCQIHIMSSFCYV